MAGSILDEQVELETQAVRDGVRRYRRLAGEAVERGEGSALKPAERLLLHWYMPLVEAIREERRHCRHAASGEDRNVYGPAMLLIDAERLAVITLHETVSACMSEPNGAPVLRLAHAIGRAVFGEANLDLMKHDARDELKVLSRRCRELNPMRVNWWAKKTLENPAWSRKIAAKTGGALMWLLVGVASADDYGKPFALAFHRERKWVTDGKRKKSVAMLRMDRRCLDLIDEGHHARQHMRPRYLPMVVPPYPWQPEAQGGYVRIRTPFISKPTHTQKAALKDADLSSVYDCLNAVNATPWRINGRILDVVREVWQQGGGVTGVPHARNFPIPPRPDEIDDDPEVKAAWKAEASEIHGRNARLRGERKEFLNKLGVAEQMAARDEIYFPHQFDFRGRAYPIPPHLNHQGDDLCRGLLEFADAKPLDDRGRWWLKVHMANCCDVDKVPFESRVDWVEANMHRFAAWADDPLGNPEWQFKPDGKPDTKHAWQKLAAALALFDPGAAARLPIQMDGTCNGLQHYAAMGRDIHGAGTVNMLPADEPADVYSQVAEATAALVEADARHGVPEAITLSGHIGRATVKQVVMTSVYGVTIVGARKQVYEQLDDVGLDDDARYKASMYLSRVVLRGMAQVCPGATALMAWLRSCAKIVAAQGEPIRWTTPLGLPVVQPYRKYHTVAVKTLVGTLQMLMPDDDVPVSPGRQCDGFAPNFVHSVDATHMMLTARSCARAGMAFAAVHDSYWTHAVDVDRMGRHLREQFVELHNRPLLELLRDELSSRFDAEFPEPPPAGRLDLAVVMNAPYFFS